MKFTVYPGSSQTQHANGMNISGFVVVAKAVHGTVNTAFDADDQIIDPRQVNLTCNARIGGEDITIFSGSLGALAIPGNFHTDAFRHIWGYQSKYGLQDPHGAANSAVALGAYHIKLPTFLNLEEDDQLTVSVTVANGAFHDDCSVASSFISVSAVNAMGAADGGIPVIDVVALGSGETNFQATRQNLRYAYFAHVENTSTADFDVEGIADSEAILSQMSVQSDIWEKTATFSELVAERALIHRGETNIHSRGQSFCLYDGADLLPKARINLNLNGSNVTGGENYVTLGYVRPSTYVQRNSQRIVQKVARKKGWL